MKERQVIWRTCSVNCGSRCALRFCVDDGELVRVETDNLPEDNGSLQMRGCLKGRAMRYWLSSSDRLDYPLKRVGPRGSGQLERIEWDEALDIVAERIRAVIDTWGNDAVLLPYATGIRSGSGSPFERLMNCLGGHLGIYGDYSCMQLQVGHSALYGDDGYYTGSSLSEVANASLVVIFGGNPSHTRMGGASGAHRFRLAREQARREGRHQKVISVNPCHTDIVSGANDEWIPVRPGTDAALVAGVMYVLIAENLIDEGMVHRYCIGYDAETLPPGAAGNGSYKDYILGKGLDSIPKTPKWAASITGCPSKRIVALAYEIASSERVFITQGWGPQRTEYGEQSARAICLLAVLTGNFGLPGTNSGTRERLYCPAVPENPVGHNDVGISIPAFSWSQAVSKYETMTARDWGVRGAERLRVPVKLIINHAGNALTNQHADINKTHDILADETLCEFIVAIDVMATDSVRYADIVLPDIAQAEQSALTASGNSDGTQALMWGEECGLLVGERMNAWDIARSLAVRLGVEDAFCAQGATSAEVDRWRLERGNSIHEIMDASGLPNGGFERTPLEDQLVALAAFRNDPIGNPLPTPSGKIEVFSSVAFEYAKSCERDDVFAIPQYVPGSEGYEAGSACPYHLQLISNHDRQSAHSSFSNVSQINAIMPRRLQVNPVDARKIDLDSEELVAVYNDRGTIVCRARITPRVMPGVVVLPQGAWHDADMAGDRIDWGGCANTLTSDVPTAWAKGNPHNSCLVELRQLSDSEKKEAMKRGL